MTVEEALVALLTAVAGILLFVGLARALDTPRRRPARAGSRARSDSGRRRLDAGAALDRHGRARPSPFPEPAEPAPQEAPPAPRIEPAPRPVQMALLETASAEVSDEAPPLTPEAAGESSLVEECLRMYQEGEYAQLIETATPAIRPGGEGSSPLRTACDRATLWSLVGLARQSLGDRGGARQAFETGLGSAAAQGVAELTPGAAALATVVAGQVVAATEASADAPQDVAAALAVARALLALALAVEPDDEAIRALAARAGDVRWTLVERRASALLGRREFEEARRAIEEALGAPDLPAPRREALRDLLWSGVTGEVGGLTARALEGAPDVNEALAWLDRAAAAVRRMPAGALTPEQDEDLVRRLWWGHTKLGVQRVEAGEPEAALPALYRALDLPGIDTERQAQTRRALGRALEAHAQRVQEEVQELLAGGDRSGAEARGQALCRVIDEAFERGLGPEDLADASAKRQHVMALVAGLQDA